MLIFILYRLFAFYKKISKDSLYFKFDLYRTYEHVPNKKFYFILVTIHYFFVLKVISIYLLVHFYVLTKKSYIHLET
jgi:hypothetical protein